jgi:hypothetical protein
MLLGVSPRARIHAGWATCGLNSILGLSGASWIHVKRGWRLIGHCDVGSARRLSMRRRCRLVSVLVLRLGAIDVRRSQADHQSRPGAPPETSQRHQTWPVDAVTRLTLRSPGVLCPVGHGGLRADDPNFV